MNHQTSVPLEADSMELHAPTYDPQIDDNPPSNKEIKKKSHSTDVWRFFQGPKAAMAHHQSYQFSESTELKLSYKESITTATPTYQWFFLMHPICLSHDDLHTHVWQDFSEAPL